MLQYKLLVPLGHAIITFDTIEMIIEIFGSGSDLA